MKVKYYSNKKQLFASNCRKAFGLIEAVTALAILAFICSTILAIINQCVASASDSMLRMQAFEIARDNMEKLLSSDSVEETVEYGFSDMFPDIQWQINTETFSEPMTERIWVRAVCSAEYTDHAGELQKVELTNWLTSLSQEDLLKLLKLPQDWTEDQLLATTEEAAAYAGVEVDIIEKWIENGMPLVEEGEYEGYYIINQLDLYIETNGNPTLEDKLRWREKMKGEGIKTDDQEDEELFETYNEEPNR
jgi:hypothetical protein